MDVFALREKLVGDYRRYAESFLTIRDERIAAHVQAKLDEGLLWPDPPLQLNPAFEPGGLIDELIDDGVLHDECRRIFRAAKSESDPVGRAILLHKHQADAIRAASTGANYVLTTGTGSGKSLAYIVPIVDYVLRNGAGDGRIKAIVVYPMNALANSQENELAKFLKLGYPQGKPPVTFRRYTGQESEEQRDEIRNNPPDILLTNYVMLEYLLTRPVDGAVIRASQGLPFLVLDELHTYRGRQGADVALLVQARARALPGEESALRRDVGHDGGAGNVRRAAGRGRARGDPLVRHPRRARATSSARRCAPRPSTLMSMTRRSARRSPSGSAAVHRPPATTRWWPTRWRPGSSARLVSPGTRRTSVTAAAFRDRCAARGRGCRAPQ